MRLQEGTRNFLTPGQNSILNNNTNTRHHQDLDACDSTTPSKISPKTPKIAHTTPSCLPTPAPTSSNHQQQDSSHRLPSTATSTSHHLCSSFLLMCFSLTMGSLAACSTALSLATDSWLFTVEPYIFTQEELDAYNITDRKLLPRIEVTVRSGLWRVCTTGIAGSADLCIPIDYTQLGSGRLSGAPTCMAVVGAIRYSSPAFVIALIVVTVATVLLFIGVVQRSGKTLLASVFYVTTGICLAVAIIIYISAINDEVGYSARNSRHIDFDYSYGWSFFSACLAFLACAGAAVLSTLQHLRIKARKGPEGIIGDMAEPSVVSDTIIRIWTSCDGNTIYEPT